MKKAGFVIVVIVLLLIINSLLHSIYDLWHKQDLITSAQKQLDNEKLKNQELRTKLTYAQSPQFIDEQARNKLFLVKPGEQEVLISDKLINQGNTHKQKETTPKWQQWLNLFF